jgi:hypothetical protein
VDGRTDGIGRIVADVIGLVVERSIPPDRLRRRAAALGAFRRLRRRRADARRGALQRAGEALGNRAPQSRHRSAVPRVRLFGGGRRRPPGRAEARQRGERGDPEGERAEAGQGPRGRRRFVVVVALEALGVDGERLAHLHGDLHHLPGDIPGNDLRSRVSRTFFSPSPGHLRGVRHALREPQDARGHEVVDVFARAQRVGERRRALLRRRRARVVVVGRVRFARRDAAPSREDVLGDTLEATLDGRHELELAVAPGRALELERDAARGARRIGVHASVGDAPETRQEPSAECAQHRAEHELEVLLAGELGGRAHLVRAERLGRRVRRLAPRAPVALARIDERPGLELQGQPAKGVARLDADLAAGARATGRRCHRCDRARAARDRAARASRAPRCVSSLGGPPSR